MRKPTHLSLLSFSLVLHFPEEGQGSLDAGALAGQLDHGIVHLLAPRDAVSRHLVEQGPRLRVQPVPFLSLRLSLILPLLRHASAVSGGRVVAALERIDPPALFVGLIDGLPQRRDVGVGDGLDHGRVDVALAGHDVVGVLGQERLEGLHVPVLLAAAHEL